ncbi:MAG: hypothetical protein V4634_23300, partial [Pseudomonadota bacterium]
SLRTKRISSYVRYEVYEQEYSNVCHWREILEKLPEALELEATGTERFDLAQYKKGINKEILKEARSNSIFSQMSQQVHVIQGKKVVRHGHFGLSEITEMKESSYYIELPASEIADPVGAAIERLRLIGDVN